MAIKNYFLYLDNLNIKFHFLRKRVFETAYLTARRAITKTKNYSIDVDIKIILILNNTQSIK